MIALLSRSAAKSVAVSAVLLGLGFATTAAQTAPTATDGNSMPAAPTVQAAPSAQAASVKDDAIRVPAMGGGASQPGVSDANAAAPAQIRTASKPKKRARIVHRDFEDEDEIVYVRPPYAPHYHYAPRPAYRIGHGIGPGFVYGPAW